MKNTVLLLTIATLVCSAAQAQNRRHTGFSTLYGPLEQHTHHLPSPQVIVTDTLRPDSYSLMCGQTGYIIPVVDVNGDRYGYLGGTNSYGDTEKGQAYRRSGSATVTGAIAFLQATNGTNPDLHAAVYGFGADGEVDASTQVLSEPVPIDQIPLANGSTTLYRGAVAFTFTNPVPVSDRFLVTVQVPQGDDGDTAAVASTADGCHGADSASFERWDDGSFHDIASVYGDSTQDYNLDFWVFPIVQFDDAVTANLAKMSAETRVAPIPASDRLAVILPANLKGNNAWQLIAADGRVARTGRSGELAFTIEGGNLSGAYTLRIQTSAGPVVKRVIFTR